MLNRRILVMPVLLASVAWSGVAMAQTAAPAPAAPEGPCQVTPGENDDGSLTDTLDDCNGVLKPPAVGDPGMVEQAPDVGETPVIEPEAVPAQPGAETGETPETGTAPGYSVGQIVDAIGQSGPIAGRLDTIGQEIEVRDISILLDGVDAAVINASLAVHREEVRQLQLALEKEGRVVDALKAEGLTSAGIVAADIDDSGKLTIFAR